MHTVKQAAFFSTNGDPLEPVFVLGASDPDSVMMLTAWVEDRTARVMKGELPLTDIERLVDARVVLLRMQEWQHANRPAPVKPPAPAVEQPSTEPSPTEQPTAPPPPDAPAQAAKVVPIKPPVGDAPKPTKKVRAQPKKVTKLETAIVDSKTKEKETAAPADNTKASQRVKLAK